MKRLTLLTMLLATLAVLPAPGAAAPTGAPENVEARGAGCDTVRYGGRIYIMYRRGIGCTSARRKVRHVHRHKRLAGWRCSSGSRFRTGGSCTRGRRLFGWHPVD